jgi:putative ABC transport system permease protein
VGIVASRNISKDNAKSLGVRNYDSDIYIPINTMLMRIENRSKLTSLDVRQGYKRSSMNTGNYHQLDQLTVRVKNTDEIQTVAEIIKKMLTRRHNGVEDFEMVIPELLLKQEQDTKQIFNFVLGAIASISLIVGGIGIMNIMLASVLERTKEIGIRMAVGAKKTDVMTQFLSEAVAISISGGIIGIILGISASYAIEMSTEIKTFVSVWSVLISFVVSISVGLIFGILPAKKAANQDPIDLLRYE